MDKFSDVFDSARLSDLDDAFQKREDLQREIDKGFTSEPIERAYKFHLSKANERVYEILRDPNTQQEIAVVGSNALESLEQIKALQDNNLPIDELADEKKEQESRLERAVSALEQCETTDELANQFMRVATRSGSIATSQSVEQDSPIRKIESVLPESSDITPDASQAESHEQEKRQVSLKISSKAVRIGGQGKLVPFRVRDQKGTRDYSAERKAALVFMVQNQDREVTPSEIWDFIKEKTTKTDDEVFYDTMKAVRSWFENVTHRRTPIFQHNGAKGPGSRYSVNPSINLTISEKSKLSYAQPDVASETQDTEQLQIDEQVIKEDTKSPEELCLSEITSKDLCLVATKLANFNYILDGYGLPTVDKDILQELRHAAKNEVIDDDSSIEIARGQAFDKVVEMLKDEDRFVDYIDSLSDDSPEYRFIEYFFDIDDPKDQELIKRIIYSETTQEYQLEHRSVLVSREDERTVLDEFGNQIWPIPDGVEVKPKLVQDDDLEDSAETEKPSEGSEQELERIAEEADAEELLGEYGGGTLEDPVEIGQLFERSDGTKVSDERSSVKADRREKFDEIKESLRSTAITLKNNYNMSASNGGLTHAQYVSLPHANANVASEALAGNMLEQNERDRNKTYTTKDILVIMALKNSRNTYFDITNRKTKGAKAINRAIDEVISEVWG